MLSRTARMTAIASRRKGAVGRRTMSDEARLRLRDVCRWGMDHHGHSNTEGRIAVSRIRNKRMNGMLLEIPERSWEHYIARTDGDVREPSKAIIRAIAEYAGVNAEGVIGGRYYIEGGQCLDGGTQKRRASEETLPAT